MQYFRLHLKGESVAKLYLQQHIPFFISQKHNDKQQCVSCFSTFLFLHQKKKKSCKYLTSFTKLMDKAQSLLTMVGFVPSW